MESWIWVLIGLAAGLLIGGGVVWLWKQGGGSGRTVAELEQENQRFKAEVTDHFVETARLINQLTDSYKAVFDHLSGGAQRLVDPKDLSERLAVEHREVRLHRIGASPSDASTRTAPPGGAGKTGSGAPAGTGSAQKPPSKPASSPEAGSKPAQPPRGKA